MHVNSEWKKVMKKILFCLSCLLLANCATILKGTKEKVYFNSSPQEAELYINDQYAGKTPINLKLTSDKNYRFQFKKAGYENYTVDVGHSLGFGWVLIDIPLYLVPLLLDAMTGAWYYLDNTAINVSLTPTKNTKTPELPVKKEPEQAGPPDPKAYLKEQQERWNSPPFTLWDWLMAHSIHGRLPQGEQEGKNHEK